MITYDQHGPHGSGSGPIWIVKDPARLYPDGRFDDPAIPDASTPVWESEMSMTPPLNPQQYPPYVCYVCGRETNDPHTNHEGEDVCADCCDICKNEQIAEAARVAIPDIETVFRTYGHIQTHPLLNLRALRDLLKPPTPKWEPRNGGDF